MNSDDLQTGTRAEQRAKRGRQRRGFELSTEQWEELDLVCKRLGIVSPTNNKGEPSINGLLRQIADRQLIVLPDPEPPAVIDVHNERIARSRNRSIMSRLVLGKLEKDD